MSDVHNPHTKDYILDYLNTIRQLLEISQRIPEQEERLLEVQQEFSSAIALQSSSNN